MRIKNILLTGFMGCGKSTIAKALSENLGWAGLDTDKMIEFKFGLSVKEIFSQKGEDFFRAAEKELAKELLEYEACVIATGGGFYKFLQKDERNFIIYLKADFDFIFERLGKKGLKKRPLFADKEAARELYLSRISAYEEKANLIIDVTKKGTKEIIKEILKEIK